MKISDLSIKSIVPFILGEQDRANYRSGPDLVEIFNMVGFRDDYWSLNSKGLFGARKDFVKAKLLEINGKKQLKDLLEILVDARQSKSFDADASNLNEILKHDSFQLIQNTEGVYKISGANLPDEISVKPVFDSIEKEIIEHIKSSKFSIWVAVAWITSRPIAKALYGQYKKGINVRIVVNDDVLTKNKGIEFEKTGIEYYKLSPKNGNFSNLMHHKFCIIDFKKVITGSFNWTVKASFNNENISIIDQRDQAEKYAEEFIKLIANLPRK